MKILDISDRGIKIIEDGEVINQGIFNEESEIPFEVKELLSIYDNSDNILLKITFILNEDIVLQIKKVIREAGWKLKEPQNMTRKLKIIFFIIITLEIVLIGFFYFKKFNLKNQIFQLKKENIEYKKKIASFTDKIQIEVIIDESDKSFFKKSDLNKLLIFLSEVSKKSGVNYQKIQILDKKIMIDGFGENMKNLSELKKFISSYDNIKNSKFDFIRREGEILYFLIELEQK